MHGGRRRGNIFTVRATTRKYIASGRFIHDELILRCNSSVEHVYKLWKRDKKINAGAIAWPEKTLVDDSGEDITGVVTIALPEDGEELYNVLQAFTERVKPYGLFVIRQEPTKITASLETKVGVRQWTIPIYRSADVFILGSTLIDDDRGGFGFVKQNDSQ